MATRGDGGASRGQAAVGDRIGPYEVIRPLGQGGMGEVHLARDLRLGRLVAVKLLTTQRPDLDERFLAEARATARCRHDNIVVVYEVGAHGRQPYMVLEYLEGQTLRTTRASFHRDLKPEIVMLTRAGAIKVLGIAKWVEAPTPASGAADDEATMAVSSTLAGTRPTCRPSS